MKKSPREKKKREAATLPSAPNVVRALGVSPHLKRNLHVGVITAVTGAFNRLAIIGYIVGFHRD
jgi:hypothetical protein